MIQVGIIGLGKIAFSYSNFSEQLVTHAQVISADSDFQLNFGIDPNESTRKLFSQKFGVPTFATLEEAKSEGSLDLYVISSPPITLSRNLEAVIHRKPTFVLLEKPIADNLDEARRYRNLKNLGESKVFVNYQRNYHPHFLSLATELALIPEDDKVQISGNFYGDWRNTGSHLVSLVQSLVCYEKASDFVIFRERDLLSAKSPKFDLQIRRHNNSQGSFFNLSIITRDFHVRYESSLDSIEYFRFGPSKVFQDETCLVDLGEKLTLNEPECLKYVYRNIANAFHGRDFFVSDLNSGIETLEWIGEIDK
jgi:hypothetical protein